jgi:hypothetical protein
LAKSETDDIDEHEAQETDVEERPAGAFFGGA